MYLLIRYCNRLPFLSPIICSYVDFWGNIGLGYRRKFLLINEGVEKDKGALDGTKFVGRTLKVDEARPRKQRSKRNY